ncbi:MAG TPA: toll/interleukin-1 receptor domain-containing protein [Thermoanaerobaculia bacterium]|jgi:hypothetical protein|nr:toll/interleukin-1 receptor domain-containing protein [Thermoanaerobaculia bacterium]
MTETEPANWPALRVPRNEAIERLAAAIDAGERIRGERVLTEKQVESILDKAVDWRQANVSLLAGTFLREAQSAYERREWEDFVGTGYNESYKLRRVRELVSSDLLYLTVLKSYVSTLAESNSESNDLAAEANANGATTTVSNEPIPDIFISHSSKDSRLARALTALLRVSLHLRASQIRCTSVSGHKLRHGSETERTLRLEILQATAFIGLITTSSVESTYVLFELGARWVADKHLAPLLAKGAAAEMLRGPLSKYSALSCDTASDVHQLVQDLAAELRIAPEPPYSYQSELDVLLQTSRENIEDQETEPNKKVAESTATAPVVRAKPTATLTDQEKLAIIQSWMGSRDARLNSKPIFFDDVDSELKLEEGSAERLLELAASRWRYVVDRRGPNLILFREEPRPPRRSIVDQIPRF